MGRSVILDATWCRREWRDQVLGLASRPEVVAFRCWAPVGLEVARARARQSGGSDASEAGPEVVERLSMGSEPWPEAVVLNTSLQSDVTLAAALAHLGIVDLRDARCP